MFEITYTVYNPNHYRTEAESGLCLADAANKMMTYDGREWEIREEGDAFNLYTSQFSRNSPCGGGELTRSVIYSYAADRDAAEIEIFERVISEDWWTLKCVTDAEYLAMHVEESEDC